MDEPADDYIARKEKLLSIIQQAGRVTDGDAVEITALLGNKSLQRALHELLVESDANAQCLLMINLEDSKARYEAALAQGMARGLVRAVEALIDHMPVKQVTKG